MNTLHALIIAIDDYPIEGHKLRGCKNDANAFFECLKNYCQANGLKFNVKQLYDSAAKRLEIVENFKHYQQAENGDVCVLYYSGHGSVMRAAPQFWDEQDGMSETLVCWDSRVQGGRDMIDKELATLIFEATDGKDVHFLAVMDCCHSGGNTREVDIRSRQVKDMGDFVPKDAKAFYGVQKWVNYQPPSSRHVQLAAAKDKETAKELTIEGKPRGVFTYTLIETLNQTGYNISYNELIARISYRVRNRVKEQSPQCEAYKVKADSELTFLGAALKRGEYLLSHDNMEGWIINIGGVQGLPAGGATFLLPDKNIEIKTTDVFANYAKITGANLLNTELQFKAVLKEMSPQTRELPALKVAFSDDSEKQGVDVLKNVLQNNKSVLVTSTDNADYLICAWDGEYRLTRRGKINNMTADERDTLKAPLFRRVKGYTEGSAQTFSSDLETVANWIAKRDLENALTSIQDSEFEIIVQNGDTGADLSAPYVLNMPNREKEVLVQIGIRNKGTRPYWVSGVYFGSDFGINNEFLPKKEIRPNETAWIEFENDRRIPFMIDKNTLSWGITEIQEYFKFFISTDELNTYMHNQDGIQPDQRDAATRAIQRSERSIKTNDWRTVTIELTVRCPMLG
jgi:hypothetical protein